MKTPLRLFLLAALMWTLSCGTGGEVVRVTSVSGNPMDGLAENDLAALAEIQKEKTTQKKDSELHDVIKETPNYSVSEYLARFPDAGSQTLQDYRIGGYDVLDIIVYEEEDLSRKSVRVSADGYISFPLIGRLDIEGLNTSEAENLIAQKLAENQLLLDAHVSVTVVDYKSKQYIVLGPVKEPGTYPLQAKERVLDAISRAGGIDTEQSGKEGMIIRTENQGIEKERKVVIRIDLPSLLKGGDQVSNLPLMDKDVLYFSNAEYFYIIGQVQKPGSYPYLKKDVSLVEAISMAGGFTPIAARNRTRIIREEDGVEKIIEVKVDAITKAGKKSQDILIVPGDVIVVPESFF